MAERTDGLVPDGVGYSRRSVGNPFRPLVDPVTGGLANVLVALDGIDPARSRPWDHPPVTVTLKDFDFSPRLAIVRAGWPVTFVSGDTELHVARARGAAFFALSLPKPGEPRRRVIETPGDVELSSGAGYYWAAADLCVRVDPYAAVTNAQGEYELPQVPAGTYVLAYRVRNPAVVSVERDPETGLPFRHNYAPPGVRKANVTVTAGQTLTRTFAADATTFEVAQP